VKSRLFGLMNFFILYALLFPLATHAEVPLSKLDEKHHLYIPYVAKQLWGTEIDDWYIIDIHVENSMDAYAVLANQVGWVVQAKNIQSYDPLLWIVPYQGQRCIWEEHYFFSALQVAGTHHSIWIWLRSKLSADL
jgi:hypothetical protein